MKLIVFCLLTLALGLGSCAKNPRVGASPGKPACCVSNAAPAAPFTDKSLYQLDSTWINDAGQPLKLGSLRGEVRVVAMFFASCTYACPLIVHDLRRIQATLPAAARERTGFTLVTIDPERDTPAALHAYRAANHLPANTWTLLHGAADDTLELAALLGVKYKREATGQFSHSNLITVLNAEGEIIHQVVGLNQDIQEAVKSIVSATAKVAQSSAIRE